MAINPTRISPPQQEQEQQQQHCVLKSLKEKAEKNGPEKKRFKWTE